uniref:Pre-mRNA splicing Prp18-interacting factor n=1 Tax=Tanacetum cinerariifolium TaxID=118510 RepID=A0A6L2LSA9_TANCI|nr:pre-mRNA splicing Prp18-interacting factor [Tanacetum cinerariifolium]
MSLFNQRGCFGCGGPLDGLLCRRCTCEWCENNLKNGFCSICDSGSGNSFVYDPNPNSLMILQTFSTILHSPRHTRVSYVETILTMVMIVHHGYRLSMSRNRATIKTLVANISNHTPEPSRCFNSICYDDDDDEESTIPLNEIISQIPSSIIITLVLPTMEPEDSLITGDEDLRTILEKESEKFIKCSVEDLVPIPMESEDTNEGVMEEKVKIYSNPLFEFDDEYISSDVNHLFNEVLKDIETKDSYVSNLDEPALLVTPLSNVNKNECFDPGGDIDKIDAFLDIDVSTNIKDDHDPRSLKDELDNDDLKSMIKVIDPEIHEKTISPTYVRLPFDDRHYLSLIFVIKIFLPFLICLVNSLLLLSAPRFTPHQLKFLVFKYLSRSARTSHPFFEISLGKSISLISIA